MNCPHGVRIRVEPGNRTHEIHQMLISFASLINIKKRGRIGYVNSVNFFQDSFQPTGAYLCLFQNQQGTVLYHISTQYPEKYILRSLPSPTSILIARPSGSSL